MLGYQRVIIKLLPMTLSFGPNLVGAFLPFFSEDGRKTFRNTVLPFKRILYCIVVGYLGLMPSDALQPKAYCTNPGLQSFLLAPPGVSTRKPSSERRNYLSEK